MLSKTKLTIIKVAGAVALVAAVGAYVMNNITPPAQDAGQLGGPIEGLTPTQLAKWYKARDVFKKEFTPEEGLGPQFNGKSCYECHGQPGPVGAEGRDTTSTSILNFAKRVPHGRFSDKPLKEVAQHLGKPDVDFFPYAGGPSWQRKTITTEFPDKYPFDCQLDFEKIPVDAEIQSFRHAQPLFGLGLVDQIADSDIAANAIEQSERYSYMRGRPVAQVDRYTESPRMGRFGWKNQTPNLIGFTTNALNIEMGITTYLNPTENSPTHLGILPMCMIERLPPGPNDKGDLIVNMTYFQSLLAPPPRGEITEQVKRGEELFDRIGCAVCHKPTMHTVPDAYVVDPDSPLPNLKYMKVEALSNKPVHAYSDFLLHDMGPELADGLPQEGAKGGEWRTAPLWGLRFRKFLLHDGRTGDLNRAIMLHGGQAEDVIKRYAKLGDQDRADLTAFLKSL